MKGCPRLSELMFPHKLTVPGTDPTPLEIFNSKVIPKEQFRTTQEEADTIIVQQLIIAAPQKAIVVADDTDIFVLLLHFCHTGEIRSKTYMQRTDKGSSSKVMDIAATLANHKPIIPNLLAAHGLTGCDTVASYFGLGKKEL